MDANHPSDPACADPAIGFEHELRALILAAYGSGTRIEGTWEIESAVSDAPNWRVTIEKVPPTDRTYDPSLLDD